MPEMYSIVHNNYNRITDRIMWLSSNYILKFNVDLFIRKSTSTGKKKENFHKEVGYVSGNEYGITIIRDFNYYLSIEPSHKNNGPIRTTIGPSNIYFFKFKLNEMVNEWFKTNTVFAIKDNTYIVSGKYSPVNITVDFGIIITFIPSVSNIDGKSTIGVTGSMSNTTESFFLSVNDLLAFNDFISNFNMYESAQLMLNYMGRPEYGTNYMDLNSNNRIGN